MNKSSLLLSFKKEESFFFKPLRGAFFFEKKKQKTFICLFGLVLGQAHASEALSASDVQGIVTRVVEAAATMKKPATVAVTDRVGSVLAVWQMPGAPDPVSIMNNPDGHQAGLNGAAVPASAVAISKAITAAYLSSSYGNAFTTRTASQIIQDHFDPGTANAASGPLYGVQFSQLPCADLMTRVVPGDALSITQGPHRSPLGLAERWAMAPLEQRVRVYPALRTGEEQRLFLARSRQIDLQLRLARRRGLGRDFESLREYREGDDLRDICWTATARRGNLITRQYQTERSQPVWIVLDCGRLMRSRVAAAAQGHAMLPVARALRSSASSPWRRNPSPRTCTCL